MSKNNKNRSHKLSRVFLGVVAFAILGGMAFAGAQFGSQPIIAADTPTGDTKSVLVKFKNVSGVTDASLADRQKAQIESADSKIANATPYAAGYKSKTRSYENLPYAAYVVDAAGEESLRSDPNVEVVFEDRILEPLNIASPIPAIGGSPVNLSFGDGTNTYSGNGYAIAIIDSGVDKSSQAFGGRVIAEACFGLNETYSNAVVSSLCPGEATFSDASGSGVDCNIPGGCGHGTPVAGAAAMSRLNVDDGNGGTVPLAGVAPDAKIISIQVNAKIKSPSLCPTNPDNICAAPIESLYLAALDYVATLSLNTPIAAANLSIGSTSEFASTEVECAAFPTVAAFNSAATALRANNIAPVVAAGNSGDNASFYNKISSPACASGAIAVSATNNAGTSIASYSNNGQATDLLAPGGDIDGPMWLPANGQSGVTPGVGTSYAAPMVAGAYAVLREKHPNATVDQLTTLLQNSGVAVSDNRTGHSANPKKLINISNALAQSSHPEIISFTGPSGIVNEGTPVTLSAVVADAVSCSINNGIGNVAISGGNISVTVPGRTSYALTCRDIYGGLTTENLTLTINPAPSVPIATEQLYNESDRTFTLSWGPSTDSDGVGGYQVYLNGQLVATLDASTTAYTFDNIDPAIAYTAEIRAVDTLGAISSALSVQFGADNGDEVVPGAPNTGMFSLTNGEGTRSVVVAVLGIASAAVVVLMARRKLSHQR